MAAQRVIQSGRHLLIMLTISLAWKSELVCIDELTYIFNYTYKFNVYCTFLNCLFHLIVAFHSFSVDLTSLPHQDMRVYHQYKYFFCCCFVCYN